MFSINNSENGAPSLLRLDGSLTIYEVSQARDELLALLPLVGPQWQIDLAGLVELDSAGAQLLLAVQSMLAGTGEPPPVINHPEEALELIGLLHLQSLSPVMQSEPAED